MKLIKLRHRLGLSTGRNFTDVLESISNYFRPDGLSVYRRPDGSSLYKRP